MWNARARSWGSMVWSMIGYKLTVDQPMLIGTRARGANGVPGVGALGGRSLMFHWWCFNAGKEVEGLGIAWFSTKAKSSKGWQLLDFGRRQRGQRDGNRSIFEADQRFVSVWNDRLLDIQAMKIGQELDDDQMNKKGLVEQIKRALGLIVRWKASGCEFNHLMERAPLKRWSSRNCALSLTLSFPRSQKGFVIDK